MNISLFFWIFLAGQIAILAFCLVLIFGRKSRREEGGIAKDSSELAGLKSRINLLQDELEKTKAGYTVAQAALDDLQKKKADLNEELNRKKELYSKDTGELEKLRKESAELKSTLLDRQQELEEAVSRAPELEKELANKTSLIEVLENQNKDMASQLKELQLELEKLEKLEKNQHKSFVLTHPVDKIKIQESLDEEEAKRQAKLDQVREHKKHKIGEILLTNGFITKDALDKALDHQAKFGGSVTQYLLAYGYVDEGKLAQCLCTQLSVPYLPLSSYEIPVEIIKLVPVDIVEKHWLIPVDKIGNVLTIVMADPLDTQAIKEVEEITGCKVQVSLGLLSEITDALELYYRIIIKGREPKEKRAAPFFIDTKNYKGYERREGIRYKAKIDVHFIRQEECRASKTNDVSRYGLSFNADSAPPVGSVVTLQIDLPKEMSPLPIVTVAQVKRVIPLENNNFEIGVKIIKISEEELNTILKYASAHREE